MTKHDRWNADVKKLQAVLKKKGITVTQLYPTDFGSGRHGYSVFVPGGIILKLIQRPDGEWSLRFEPASFLKEAVSEHFPLHERKPRTDSLVSGVERAMEVAPFVEARLRAKAPTYIEAQKCRRAKVVSA